MEGAVRWNPRGKVPECRTMCRVAVIQFQFQEAFSIFAMAAARPPRLLTALAPRGALIAEEGLDAPSELGLTDATLTDCALSEPSYHHHLPSAHAPSVAHSEHEAQRNWVSGRASGPVV